MYSLPINSRGRQMANETTREYEEREAAAMAEASRTFKGVIRPIDAEYVRRSLDIQPYHGSPRWERARDALYQWRREQTAEAHELYIRHVDELMASGEISEELGDEWTALGKKIAEQFATSEAA